MKRFLFTICMLFPLMAIAQSNYSIYSVRGDVLLQRAGERKWIKAQKLTNLDLDDILDVKKGGEVVIAENNVRPYSSVETGKRSVRDRVSVIEKSRQKKGLVYRVASVLFQKESPQEFPRVSSTLLERCDTCRLSTELYDSVYTCILQFIQNKIIGEANVFVVEKKFGPDGTFTVTITNNSDRLFYFNAVHVTDGHPAICYYIDDMDFIPLQPGTTVDLAAFPLIQDQGQYILIASDVNLSVELLEATFESEPILSSCELECIKLKRL